MNNRIIGVLLEYLEVTFRVSLLMFPTSFQLSNRDKDQRIFSVAPG